MSRSRMPLSGRPHAFRTVRDGFRPVSAVHVAAVEDSPWTRGRARVTPAMPVKLNFRKAHRLAPASSLMSSEVAEPWLEAALDSWTEASSVAVNVVSACRCAR